MLDQLRSFAGNIGAKLLLGFLVVTFAIWGIGDIIRHPGHNQTVAKVGDQSITLETFQQNYRREVENVHRSLGENYSPEILKSLNISDRVLHRLINRTLLRLESEHLGLIPSDADVVRRIRSNPSFQDSKGNFDKSLFQAALRNNGLSEQAYVNQLREDMASSLAVDTFTSATPVFEFAALTMYEALEEKRIATLYTLSPSLISDIPQPSEEETLAYYKAHSQEFSAPEYRTVSYASLSSETIRHKAPAASEADLRAAYKERSEEFKRPERRNVEQLLYNNEDAAKAAYAKLQSGASFADTAASTDAVNKPNLSLGNVSRDAILDAAASAVFALKSGEFTPPVKSPFGWHIFKVTAITPPSVAPFEEVRPALEKDAVEHGADNAFAKFTNKLEDMLASGSTLAETAKELELTVHTAGPVSHDGHTPDGAEAKDLPALDKFLDTVFKTDEKTESALIPSKGGLYYVVYVDSLTPERIKTLAEVRGAVIASWQKAEREKRLLALAKEIAQKLSADEAGRNTAIAQYHLQGVSSGPLARTSRSAGSQALPPVLVADIFAHNPGKSTDAYPMKDGSYMVALIKEIVPVPASGDSKTIDKLADIHKNMAGTTQNELILQYMNYLAGKYPVSINQGLLESVLQ